jgi:hypothetical protein
MSTLANASGAIQHIVEELEALDTSASTTVASQLAQALRNLTPQYWEASHQYAAFYAQARAALAQYDITKS